MSADKADPVAVDYYPGGFKMDQNSQVLLPPYSLLLDDLPFPSFVYRPDGDMLILEAYNVQAVSFSHGQKLQPIGSDALAFYREQPAMVSCLTRCRDRGGSAAFERPYLDQISNQTLLLSFQFKALVNGSILLQIIDSSRFSQHGDMEQLVCAPAHDLTPEQAILRKGEILARLSRQLYAPLNAIVGLGHLLGRTTLAPAQVEYLSKINRAAHQVLGLVNDLQVFSELETGQIAIETEDFVLREPVQTAFEQARTIAATKNIKLSLTEAPGLPAIICGDARRLHQILFKLLENAVQYTISGEVELQVKPTILHGAPAVECSVRDTGVGISPEQLPQLFHPFIHTDGRTGLGLVICHELIQRMGGGISVESEPNQGSCFRIVVPVRGQSGPITMDDRKNASDAGTIVKGKRVLLVEDNDINRLVVTETLRQLGLEVVSASSGPQAINLVAQGHFDLIFMDIMMPGMDGYNAARIIHQGPSGVGIPIIALTAYAGDTDRVKSRQAGMVAHLGKPINPIELQQTIETVLSGNTDHPSLMPATEPDGFDRDAIRAQLGGNSQQLDELLGLFLLENQSSGANLHQAIAAGKLEDARRIAHTLKGSAANLSLTGISSLARQLEVSLQSNTGPLSDPQHMQTITKELQSRVSSIELALQALDRDIAGTRPQAAKPLYSSINSR